MNEAGELKMARSIDPGMVFGKKDPTNERQDIAKSTGDTIVLSIDRAAFDRIRAETVQNDAEQKIEFLLRYVPRLRMSPRNIIEELDILFIKECYTKGFRILKEGELNEHVYFVRSGTCRLLQPIMVHSLSALKNQFSGEELSKYKYVNLCSLGIGQAFGEDSALNSIRSQEAVEAESETVDVYKISRAMLLQYFGGSASEVIYSIRAGVQAKRNWIQLKTKQLANAKKEDLLKAGMLRDESEIKLLKPTMSVPGEVPYLKMVQTYGKVTIDSGKTKPAKQEEDKNATRAEEEPKLVPPPAPKPQPRVTQRNTFMVGKAPDEEYKDNSVRGFGTMRLVPSNRLNNITNPQQMRGLDKLRIIANNIKSGGVQMPSGKTNFDKESVKKFQNTVMMADPAIAEKGIHPAKPSLADMNTLKKMRKANPE